MKFMLKSSAFLFLIVLAGCASSTPVGDGCEWIPQPPPLELCSPLQDPAVDGNLIGECTSLTKDLGDWLLGVAEQGQEVCRWKF